MALQREPRSASPRQPLVPRRRRHHHREAQLSDLDLDSLIKMATWMNTRTVVVATDLDLECGAATSAQDFVENRSRSRSKDRDRDSLSGNSRATRRASESLIMLSPRCGSCGPTASPGNREETRHPSWHQTAREIGSGSRKDSESVCITGILGRWGADESALRHRQVGRGRDRHLPA